MPSFINGAITNYSIYILKGLKLKNLQLWLDNIVSVSFYFFLLLKLEIMAKILSLMCGGAGEHHQGELETLTEITEPI